MRVELGGEEYVRANGVRFCVWYCPLMTLIAKNVNSILSLDTLLKFRMSYFVYITSDSYSRGGNPLVKVLPVSRLRESLSNSEARYCYCKHLL